MEIDLLVAELKANGITVLHNGTCHENLETPMSCQDKVEQLRERVRENKQAFKDMWRRFCILLNSNKKDSHGGLQTTERMFASAIKCAYKFSKRFHYFTPYRNALKKCLSKDINEYHESVMSKTIDYHIALDWLYITISDDVYKICLLNELEHQKEKERNVVAQQMTPSALDLPMKERCWKWEEDEEDWDKRQKDIRNQSRYQLPETYDDPEKFEEGFYWREMRNDPYSFWDEENDPYPHYYNYKSKVHRGYE